MPVCCRCEADGVMKALGGWYCLNHLEDGFLDVAAFLARMNGWDENDVVEALRAWLDSERP